MSRGGGSSGGAGGTGGSAASGTGGVTACTDAIVTSPVNNYAFSSILSFQTITVQPDTLLHFDWGSVTRDLLGHAVDPLTEIDSVDFILWELTPEALAENIRRTLLQQDHIALVGTFYTEKRNTEAGLLDFGGAEPLTPEDILPYLSAETYPPRAHTYTAMIKTGDVLGRGYRMIQAFTLDPASTNTLVEVTNTSTHIEYSVDLESHQRPAVPAGRGDITIDWTGLDVNALGDEVGPDYVSEVVVARYDESAAELEDQFFDLELIAEDIWRAEVSSGMTMELSSLTNGAGEPFAGIDGNGTWVVALLCGACQNPAPWYLSVLTPCPPGEP